MGIVGFGDALYDAYQQASDTAKESFNSMINTLNEITETVVDGTIYAAEKTLEGAIYVGDKVIDGTVYVAEKTVEGAVYVKDQVVQAKKNVDDYLAPQPAGKPIVICKTSKKNRVMQRKEKLNKAKTKASIMQPSLEKSLLKNSIDRFEFNNKAIEMARLADNTYSIGQNDAPSGWKRITVEEIEALGLDPDVFTALDEGFDPSEHEDGYFVEMYKADMDVFGEEKYVLAFRGTQGKKDWKTNAKQGFGEDTEHYSNAINIAKDAYAALGDKLEITGHSLGAGMATAAGITSGTKTYAFNPAGVHPATLERAGDFLRTDAFNKVNEQNLVDNIVVPGELLTSLQDPTVQRSVIAGSIYSAPQVSGVLLAQDRAFIENGTISYGMAGVRHNVPLLGNAAEVAKISASGGSIQGMTPSKAGYVNATVNPVKKVDMHGMHTIIAGIEQQKSDDLFLIDSQI